jgi:hypothetical protein
VKRGGKQKGDGCRRSKAGKNAYQGSDQCPHKAVEEIDRLKGYLKTIENIIEYVHAANTES